MTLSQQGTLCKSGDGINQLNQEELKSLVNLIVKLWKNIIYLDVLTVKVQPHIMKYKECYFAVNAEIETQ